MNVFDVVEDHIELLHIEGHTDGGFDSVVIAYNKLRRSLVVVGEELSGVPLSA